MTSSWKTTKTTTTRRSCEYQKNFLQRAALIVFPCSKSFGKRSILFRLSGLSACHRGSPYTPHIFFSPCREGRGCTLYFNLPCGQGLRWCPYQFCAFFLVLLFEESLFDPLAQRTVTFHLAVRAGVALRALVFQLAVRAGVALHAALFLLPVRAAVALHAAVFQPAVGVGSALRALAFHPAVDAPVALHAAAFLLAMRASIALRAVVFHPAVDAPVALRTAAFPLAMCAPLHSRTSTPANTISALSARIYRPMRASCAASQKWRVKPWRCVNLL